MPLRNCQPANSARKTDVSGYTNGRFSFGKGFSLRFQKKLVSAGFQSPGPSKNYGFDDRNRLPCFRFFRRRDAALRSRRRPGNFIRPPKQLMDRNRDFSSGDKRSSIKHLAVNRGFNFGRKRKYGFQWCLTGRYKKNSGPRAHETNSPNRVFNSRDAKPKASAAVRHNLLNSQTEYVKSSL